jgi:hypothetical protein
MRCPILRDGGHLLAKRRNRERARQDSANTEIVRLAGMPAGGRSWITTLPIPKSTKSVNMFRHPEVVVPAEAVHHLVGVLGEGGQNMQQPLPFRSPRPGCSLSALQCASPVHSGRTVRPPARLPPSAVKDRCGGRVNWLPTAAGRCLRR